MFIQHRVKDGYRFSYINFCVSRSATMTDYSILLTLNAELLLALALAIISIPCSFQVYWMYNNLQMLQNLKLQ